MIRVWIVIMLMVGTAYAAKPSQWVQARRARTPAQVVPPGGPSWSYAAPLPEARGSGVTSVYENNIYYIGGVSGGSAKTNMYVFDGSTWTEVPGIPTATSHKDATIDAGEIYIIAGSGASSVYYSYKTGTGVWTSRPALPATLNRSGFECFYSIDLNTALFILGGNNGSTALTTTYKSTFRSFPAFVALPQALDYLHMNTCIYSNRIYVFGGKAASDEGTNIWSITLTGTSWRKDGVMPSALGTSLYNYPVTVYSNSVWLFARSAGSVSNMIWRWNGTWTEMPISPIMTNLSFAGAKAEVLNNAIYLMGSEETAAGATNVYRYGL